MGDTDAKDPPDGVLRRIGELLTPVHVTLGIVATLVGLAVTFGVIVPKDQTDRGPADRAIKKAEIAATADVPSLRLQSDIVGANDYGVDNTIDSNPKTAWVEGRRGLARGARLTFTFPRIVHLTRIQILAGYAKSVERFYQNAVPTEVVVRSTATAPFRWKLARSLRPQAVQHDFGRTRVLTLEIAAVSRGTTYDDTAISELWFFERPAV